MGLFIIKLQKYLRSFSNRFKKTKIKAVHDSDLLEVLKSLGVLEDIENNKATCIFCRDLVSLETIEAIFQKEGRIKFICSKPECISKL